jgi:GNAT superfamily N-acetyltransferase
MVIKVYPLTEKDTPGAIEVIQVAFAEDPYFRWVFDEKNVCLPCTKYTQKRRKQQEVVKRIKLTSNQFNKIRNYGSLEARCLWGIKNAIFHVAKEESGPEGPEGILGVSCWLPPHPPSQPETWTSWYEGWVLWFRQGLNNLRHGGRGGLNVKRYYIWKERQAEAQGAIWDDERGYYFCNIVAVRPEAQGKGVGRLLFEEVTRKADEEGVKCYLESSRNQPNVGIYEKLGFDMRKVMECRDESSNGEGEGEGEGNVCMVCTFLEHLKGIFADLDSYIAWFVNRRRARRELQALTGWNLSINFRPLGSDMNSSKSCSMPSSSTIDVV